LLLLIIELSLNDLFSSIERGLFYHLFSMRAARKMRTLNDNNSRRKILLLHNTYLATTTAAATIFTLTIIFASTTISPVSASATVNATATTGTPSALELSSQPIWNEQATSTGVTSINETHSIGTFIGNGTITVPDTGETINMTNNGTAFISPVPGYTDTVSASGREYVFSEVDDDTIAITFHEIIRYDPTTFAGKGVIIAVFDNNATGTLAPFNGMMVVGTHEDDPTTRAATIKLWEWESGIPILPVTTTTDMEESLASPTMNTTTTTVDAMDTNATTATDGEEQQQTTTTISPTPMLE
jgi:hypothetical protein